MQFEVKDEIEERGERNSEEVFQHKERAMRLADKRLKFQSTRKKVGDVDSDEFMQSAKARSVHHRYRKYVFEQTDHFKDQDIVDIYKQQDGCCPACFKDLSEDGYEVDHKTALTLAGNNSKYNIQLLCPPCNASKGGKDYNVWISKLRFTQVKEYLLELMEEGY